jgi:hypothetical protein
VKPGYVKTDDSAVVCIPCYHGDCEDHDSKLQDGYRCECACEED